MGRALGRTAELLACSERTLRRYVNDGLLRSRQLPGFDFELPEQEERYAREHWELLHGLRRALRTERDVRLVVLFGSMATGEDAEESDVDLLVSHRRGGPRALAALRRRLFDALGRRVHVIGLDAARQSSPNLLADALTVGRVIVDRDGIWPEFQAGRDRVFELAKQEDAETLAFAHAAVEAARERREPSIARARGGPGPLDRLSDEWERRSSTPVF